MSVNMLQFHFELILNRFFIFFMSTMKREKVISESGTAVKNDNSIEACKIKLASSQLLLTTKQKTTSKTKYNKDVKQENQSKFHNNSELLYRSRIIVRS